MPPPSKNQDKRSKEKAPPPPAPPIDPERYTQPGDVVYYYPHGDRDQQPHCAVVTQVGLGGLLSLNAISPDLRTFAIIDAALPMGDPRLKQGTDFADGGWEHKPETILLRRAMIATGYMRWDAKTERYVIEETFIWNNERQTYATNTPTKEPAPAIAEDVDNLTR